MDGHLGSVRSGWLAASAFSCMAAVGPSVAHAEVGARELAEQGRYLAIAGDCGACHTRPEGGKAFAGGYAIESPVGPIYSTNITSSSIAGIGAYSEAQFSRALREGIRRDGTHLYPAMPYTAYAKLSDTDVRALYVYFTQSVQAVDEQPPVTRLPFPFNVRTSMSIWNTLFLSTARFTPDPHRSAEWNRGAYVAEALEHCGACHTPRGALMAEESHRLFAGARVGGWYAPNITSDPVSGIGAWTRDELVQYLKTGALHGKAQAAGGMAEAVSNSLQYLTSQDLEALATYLLSVSPIRDQSDSRARDTWGAPVEYEAELRGRPTTAGSQQPEGNALYSGNCASCHQPTGAGTADHSYPALFHNSATGAQHADNLVAAILFGVDREVGGSRALMPRFDATSYVQPLNDAEVATVANYVLHEFGNPAVHVTIDDVAAVRSLGFANWLVQVVDGLLIFAGVAIVTLGLWILWRRRRVHP
jgi:fructose 5-dehydrogenase cytochrome subunit